MLSAGHSLLPGPREAPRPTSQPKGALEGKGAGLLYPMPGSLGLRSARDRGVTPRRDQPWYQQKEVLRRGGLTSKGT